MSTSPSSPQAEPSIWSDLQRFLRAKREEWRKKNRERFARSVRGTRISQLPREYGPTVVSLPKPEALEPGFDGLRIWILLFLFSAAFLLAGVQFGGRFGLVVGFIATLGLNLWIFFISPSQMARALSTWDLDGRDPWGLLEAAREAANLAHIPAPRISLSDTDQFFSLSVGLSSTRSTIILSHGLVERLDPEELRLIIAFETAKIASQWTASATAAAGLARLLSVPGFPYFAIWALRLSLGGGRILKIDDWVAAHGESRELWARTLWTLDSMMASKPYRFPISQAGLQTVFTSEIFRGTKHGAAWGSLTEIRSSRYEKSLPGVRTRIGALIDRFPP